MGPGRRARGRDRSVANPYRNTDANCNCNGDTNSHANGYVDAYTFGEAFAYAEASSNSATSPIAEERLVTNVKWLGTREKPREFPS